MNDMTTILDELAAFAKMRVEESKKKEPLSAVRQRAEEMPDPAFRFEEALRGSELAFICECKKASPSRD